VGKSFPKIKQTGPSCIVIEVVPNEKDGQWRVGFYRAAKGANDMVRLCDLDSANGTYFNGERVQAVELEHLSEFRVGSSWLMVTIVPKHFIDSTSF
jgi:pSer/pThr/pTyr-binding forkhead associated (FHA) protein